MDINNNQQINTFLKGMNTDVSDALIDSSQYRYAENVRITTNNESNTGELRLIEGCEDFFKISDCGYSPTEILYTDKIRNLIVVIFNTEDETILLTVKEDDPTVYNVSYKWSDKLDYVSATCRYEDDENIYIYIADGVHTILKINITKSAEDQIKYASPKISLMAPTVGLSGSGGTIHALKAQYAYRLYNNLGETSQLSPFSNIVTIYKTNSRGQYGYKDINTGEKVRVHIEPYKSPEAPYSQYKNNKVLIYRIGYIENGQLPTINLIYDGKVGPNDVRMDYEDNGEDLKLLSIEEFYSLFNLNIIPAVIEQKDNYLFASNIKDVTTENNDLGDFDPTTDITLEIITKEQEFSKLTYDSSNRKYTGGDSSLRRGEKYRYGAVFYFEDGSKSSVKYIGDIDIPESQSICNNDVSKAVVTGVSAKLTKDLPDNVVGWELVRCKRTIEETKNISTGIVWHPLTAKVSSGDYPYEATISQPFLTMSYMLSENSNEESVGYIGAASDSKLVFFASPEEMYAKESLEERLLVYSSTTKLYIRDNYSIPTTNWTNISYDSNYRSIGDTSVKPFPLAKRTDGNWEMKYQQLFRDMNWRNYAYSDHISTGNDRYVFLNVIKPNQKYTDIANFNGREFSFDDYKSIESPDPQSFDDGNREQFKFNTDIIPFAGHNILRWTNYMAAYDLSTNDNLRTRVDEVFNGEHESDWVVRFPTSGSGKYLALSSSAGIPNLSTTSNNFIVTTASIQKTRSEDPYGDTSTNTYYSYGNYSKYTKKAAYNNYSLKVYDGDCYVRMFEYNAAHSYDSAIYSKGMPMLAVIYRIPVETDIDILALFGHSYSKAEELSLEGKHNIQDKAVTFSAGSYIQDLDCYLYNTTYSQLPNVTLQTSDDDNEVIKRANYDTRTHYSLLKQNGEEIDSWLLFKTANFLDVNTEYGPITNLQTFNNHLIFWQEDATGVLSVNERTLLQNQDNANIILGNGDVLQRADYLSTLYGMQKKEFCSTKSDNALYWWDSKRRELVSYSSHMVGRTNLQVIPMTKKYGLTNYINSTQNTDKPKLAYDHKYSEMLASIVNNESLVFNEGIDAFTSIYKIVFDGSCKHNDSIILNTNGKLVEWNKSTDGHSKHANEGLEFLPYIQYVINKENTFVKTFDIQTFGGRFYGEANQYNTNNLAKDLVKGEYSNIPLWSLTFMYSTPLNQNSTITGQSIVLNNHKQFDTISNRELDFRLNIPRNGQKNDFDIQKDWGNRMRGKTMQCVLKSSSNSLDFSLQYIITKYRMSWS